MFGTRLFAPYLEVTLMKLYIDFQGIRYFDNNNVMDYINRLIDYLHINNYMALSNEAAQIFWKGPTSRPFLIAWNRKKYNLSTVESSSHTNVFT